jgi:hypothetical protein
MTELSDQSLLLAVVDGDLSAFAQLRKRSPARIDAQRDSLPVLTVTKQAVLRVLIALQSNAVSPAAVQQWASFIRWGFFGWVEEPRRPLNIEYESVAEDIIVEIIARLDELGDEIDGTISAEELKQMINNIAYGENC